jgi:hypothetical protein
MLGCAVLCCRCIQSLGAGFTGFDKAHILPSTFVRIRRVCGKASGMVSGAPDGQQDTDGLFVIGGRGVLERPAHVEHSAHDPARLQQGRHGRAWQNRKQN